MVTQWSYNHLSLHFDGLRIDRRSMAKICNEIHKINGRADEHADETIEENFCDQCAQDVRNKTGYQISLTMKHYHYLVDLLSMHGEKQSVGLHEQFMRPGNCIFA
eukprot:857877-Karenia_brevis.AAC.1